ncbi:MAG: hypothetical protein AAF602_22125, partial [Myxococcota bacterium]
LLGDAMDLEGDVEQGVRTIPGWIGIAATHRLVRGLLGVRALALLLAGVVAGLDPLAMAAVALSSAIGFGWIADRMIDDPPGFGARFYDAMDYEDVVTTTLVALIWALG